jgi:hypothetical protein
MPDLTASPAEQTFFSLLAVTTRIQEILQPAIGKQFWVTSIINPFSIEPLMYKKCQGAG